MPLLDLGATRGVKAAAKVRKQLQDLRVWVARDSVEGLDARQQPRPRLNARLHGAQIHDEERVLIMLPLRNVLLDCDERLGVHIHLAQHWRELGNITDYFASIAKHDCRGGDAVVERFLRRAGPGSR